MPITSIIPLINAVPDFYPQHFSVIIFWVLLVCLPISTTAKLHEGRCCFHLLVTQRVNGAWHTVEAQSMFGG